MTSATGTPFALTAPVPPGLAGLVSKIACFDAPDRGTAVDREIASFAVPVIFSFAAPFRIGFDGPADRGERIGSFVSGLHPGFVDIGYAGSVSCLQVDFTPLGARTFFGRPLTGFSTRLVPLEDVGDRGLTDLRDRLAESASAPDRLRIATGFVEARLRGRPVDPEAAYLWSAIERSHGTLRIESLTDDLGWSRKRLSARVRDSFGLTPKRLARIARFRHAVALSGSAPRPDWAGIAVDCGYADQAHLVRDFTQLAGAPPERWRTGAIQPASKQIFNPSGGNPV